MLGKFLRVSKACNPPASSLIFQNLVLHAWKSDEFPKDIEELARGGLGEKFLIHARSVKILDSSTLTFVDDSDWRKLPTDDRKVIRYRKQWVEEFENIPLSRNPDEVEGQPLEVWDSLAAALKEFKKINNLIWVCQRRFPHCLLKIIHEKHEECQIHLRCFLPRRVSQKGINHPLDEDLIKSRNLHSVTFKLPRTSHPKTHEDIKRVFDWHEIAALQLVATAPNIEHVNIVTGFEKYSGVLYPNYLSKQGRERENLWEPKIDAKKAKLTSIIFNRWRLM